MVRRILVVVILAAVAYAVLDPGAVSKLLADRPLLTSDETVVLSTVLDHLHPGDGPILGVAEVARGLVGDESEVDRGGAKTLDVAIVDEAAKSYVERNTDVGWLPADFTCAATLRLLGEDDYAPLIAPGGARAVMQADVGVLTEVGPVLYLSRPGFDINHSVAVVSLVDLKEIPSLRAWVWLERSESGWTVLR